MAFSCRSAFNILLVVLLLAAIVAACFTLPVEKILKDFLIWIDRNLGPWGPLVLAVSYIPLTILAVPASVLTLGGGYLFGLPIGFIADSIGATIGAAAAFCLARTSVIGIGTFSMPIVILGYKKLAALFLAENQFLPFKIGRSYVISKLKDYPQFQAVAVAIQRSGFKIVLLLRLVPFLPFNMLNYLLSVTPVGIGEYMMASWLGMMPITLALVYIGTTLKDLSDVTHRWNEKSLTSWVLLILGLLVSVVLMICVTKVAKTALDKALAENVEVEGIIASPQLPIISNAPLDLHQPLIIKIDS